MENIDITDPTFSLNSNLLNNNVNLGSSNILMDYDNSVWIFIGIFILVFVSGIFMYKYYQNKKETSQLEHLQSDHLQSDHLQSDHLQ